MELKPLEFRNQLEFQNVYNQLRAALLQKEIKITSGSFDYTSILDVTFRVEATGETWKLYCMDEAPSGGGYLRREV